MPALARRAYVVLALLLASCGSMTPGYDPAPHSVEPPLFTFVFFVHGDADYAYFDARGRARRADEDVVRKAREIATKNLQAEVFIFHEVERRHFLFVFPRRDGRAYHYRNGRLVDERSYWRDQGDSRFALALQMYGDWAAPGHPASTRVLLYFGHELPEIAATGYDHSYSERQVTIDDLAQGVRALADSSGVLDVLVLSTCFGGTPYTIGKLSPHARSIVASPDNLHLSYFDLDPLSRPDLDAAEGAAADFAVDFARNAFEVLTSEVQTAVSVVVYDTAAVQPYLGAVAASYEARLSSMAAETDRAFERCDCAEDAAFALPTMADGLTTFYRAPRFGRAKNIAGHSGWECWRAAR